MCDFFLQDNAFIEFKGIYSLRFLYLIVKIKTKEDLWWQPSYQEKC